MNRFISTIRAHSWYYPIAISIVVLLGVLSTFYVYAKITTSVKKSLLEYASMVAYALPSDQIALLTGTKDDLNNPVYLSLKTKLQKIRSTSPNVRFAYLTKYIDGKIYFLVDSEPSTSKDYSPPGQYYPEAGSGFYTAFRNQNPLMEKIYSDRWGTWLTALTPIIDPNTNQTVALMGMDMNANLYYRVVLAYTVLPIGIMIFFLFILLIGLVIRRNEKRFLEFKSELVSIASHEIRTPLTGILWMTDGMLKNSADNLSSTQKENIKLIKSNSQNLLMTINDLLDFSAVENIKPKKIIKENLALAALVKELVVNFELALREKKLEIIIDPSLTAKVSILGAKDKIKRMINNLLSNAVKYSKIGGKIYIGATAQERSVVFWVKDQGIGIPASDVSKVFEGFYRAENAKQTKESGTGLGLRYVKQVATLHGGKVWLESSENVGSTFFVELPIY